MPDKHQGYTHQLVIPASLRETFFAFCSFNPLSGHLGRMKTLRRLLDNVYWPEIRKDVWSFCTQCKTCQAYKPRISKLSGLLQSIPVVEPGYMLGVDLMGPFPRSSRSNEFLLVFVDYCSKWVELFASTVCKNSPHNQHSDKRNVHLDGELQHTWSQTAAHSSLPNYSTIPASNGCSSKTQYSISSTDQLN